MNRELQIGEVATINGKWVLCVPEPTVYDHISGMYHPVACCKICAFDSTDGTDCPHCCAATRRDKTDVFYAEITKGL